MTRSENITHIFIGILMIMIAVWGGTWLMETVKPAYTFAVIITAMIVGTAGLACICKVFMKMEVG